MIFLKSLRLPFFPHLFLVAIWFPVWMLGARAAGVMPWLCLVSFYWAIRHALYEARIPSHFTWFICTYSSLFLVYPTLAPLLGTEIPVSGETFVDYCFLTACGLHLFILAYHYSWTKGGRRPWPTTYRMNWATLPVVTGLLLILSFLAIGLVVVEAGSFSAIREATRVERKFQGGSLALLAAYMLSFGSVFFPLMAVLARRQRLRMAVVVPAILVLEYLVFWAFRARTSFVLHSLAFLVGWYVIYPRAIAVELARDWSLSVTRKITLAAAVVTIVAVALFMKSFRGQIESVHSIRDVELNVAATLERAFHQGDLGYSKVVFPILELVPRTYGHLYGQSYYRLLFVPIPHSIWPDKPANTQRIVAHWLDPGASSQQTTPVGIMGDLYVNFGHVGVLGMLVFGYVFGMLDRGTRLSDVLLVSVSFAMILHLVRGGFTNPILNFIVYMVAAKLVTSYVELRPSDQEHSEGSLVPEYHFGEMPAKRGTETPSVAQPMVSGRRGQCFAPRTGLRREP